MSRTSVAEETPSVPSVFLSHGAPTIALKRVPAREFMTGFGVTLGRPRAILVVSAHWETRRPTLTAAPEPATIHDFFGFPPALYELAYPAPGLGAALDEVTQCLADADITAALDTERGLDHGSWMPLMMMYPGADIPVAQLSLCPHEPASFQLELGRALAPLRQRGFLLVGSGAMTHNLGEFRDRRGDFNAISTPPYVGSFTDWIAGRIDDGDTAALLDWRGSAPEATRAHPTVEHFLPLLVALGAAGPEWCGRRVHASTMYGVISMDSYVFDHPAALPRPA
ncbi:MAG: DODA-type extradiol aromatic ring-opening family dioxygenase [Gammaproteobacteria bacterium]